LKNEEIRLPIPVTLSTTPNTIPSLDIDLPRRYKRMPAHTKRLEKAKIVFLSRAAGTELDQM